MEVHRQARRLRTAVPGDQPALESLIAASARGLSASDYTSELRSKPLSAPPGVSTASSCATAPTWSSRPRPAGGLRWLELPQHVVRRRRARWSRAGRARSRAGLRAHPRLLRSSRLGAPRHRAVAARRVRIGGSRARFRTTELMATLPGEKLYSVRGLRRDRALAASAARRAHIDFIRMRKAWFRGSLRPTSVKLPARSSSGSIDSAVISQTGSWRLPRRCRARLKPLMIANL